MNWDQLLSTQRLGKPTRKLSDHEARTQFQRDYDRLIFSSPFRRLQNKTQVFPLPGSVVVHNRLTHSLEVSTVGRSLGSNISNWLIDRGEVDSLIPEIGTVVSAACLAHDMGNPPFGHLGEDAIKDYFGSKHFEDLDLEISPKQLVDFTKFDGNANAFRLLTHQFHGRREGGYALTHSMLVSIVKYPWEAYKAKKAKFGFFQSEFESYAGIAESMGLRSENGTFVRHPLVYLVEAADDICYQVMDIEDAHKLSILSYDETVEIYMNFFDDGLRAQIKKTFEEVSDKNERIAYLRALVIGTLVNACTESFIGSYKQIMEGESVKPLIEQMNDSLTQAMSRVEQVAYDRIYADQSVAEIEIAGFKIISTLLEEFITAFTSAEKNKYHKKLMNLVPSQYKVEKQNDYEKVQSVVDFITGMTDEYALDLYRRIAGISLPGYTS